jgi:hypothetical protein
MTLTYFTIIVYKDMLKKMPPKTSKIFECKVCDFISSKEIEYNRHLLTGKHK